MSTQMRLLSSSEQGTFLKRKFYESRVSFTQWRVNWSQSGNYDVDSFEAAHLSTRLAMHNYPLSRYALRREGAADVMTWNGSRKRAKAIACMTIREGTSPTSPDFRRFYQNVASERLGKHFCSDSSSFARSIPFYGSICQRPGGSGRRCPERGRA
jgi:hypothetical protein